MFESATSKRQGNLCHFLEDGACVNFVAPVICVLISLGNFHFSKFQHHLNFMHLANSYETIPHIKVEVYRLRVASSNVLVPTELSKMHCTVCIFG